MKNLPTSQTIRGGFTPTYGEKIEKDLWARTLKNTRRIYMQDLCDFCLKPHYMKRYQVENRKKRGWKFLCSKCSENKTGKYGKGILPCWTKGELIKQWKKKNK